MKLATLLLILAALGLPPVLYAWPFAAWMQFLLLLLCVTGPAIAIARRVSPAAIGLTGAAVSACLGISAYCLLWALTRLLGFAPLPSVLVGVVGGNMFSVAFFWAGQPQIEDSRWTPREIAVVAGLCIAVALFARGPFVHFGSMEGAAIGFPYLAVTDVFTHVAIVGEVAKQTPPMNPYFSGQTLHYYWLSHALPASFHAVTSGQFIVPVAVQMTCLAFSMMALVLFAAVLKAAITSTTSRHLALVIAIFLATYVWIIPVGEQLVAMIAQFVPAAQRLVVERGEAYSGLSHGFLRDFVTEPHGVQALNLIFALVLWNSFTLHASGWRKTLSLVLEGSVLAICLGTDAFLGVIAILWWMVVRGIGSVRPWSLTRSLATVVPVGVGLVAAFACLFALQMFGQGGGNLRIVPYVRMLVLLPVLIAIEYGPIGLLGALGGKALVDSLSRRPVRDVVLLGVIALPVMFLLQHEWVFNLVFRKSLRVVRLPLILGMALLFERMERKQLLTARWMRAAVAGVILLGLPGTLIDHYGLSRSDGLGRSVLLANRDANAYRWLRANTPPNAVIQGWPDYGDKSNFTPAIVVAERRTALGDFIRTRNYLSSEAVLRDRAHGVHEVVFGKNGSMTDVMEKIREYGITHIYVGDVERAKYGESVAKFGAHAELFQPIYREGGVEVFEVR